jgi:hypothetical protein
LASTEVEVTLGYGGVADALPIDVEDVQAVAARAVDTTCTARNFGELPRSTPTHPAHWVPPAIAALRNAVTKDVGQRTEGAPGRVIVLVSIQADEDTAATFQALATALVGTCPGDVLAINAAVGTPPAPLISPSSLKNGPKSSKMAASARLEHGFTSLLDGTRELHHVLQESDTEGVKRVPLGPDKGPIQAADAAAIARALQDSRGGFPFTVIHGGSWQNAFLPLLARTADAVYLVIRANVTEQDVARSALEHFDGLGIHVRGCIVATP